MKSTQEILISGELYGLTHLQEASANPHICNLASWNLPPAFEQNAQFAVISVCVKCMSDSGGQQTVHNR